MTAASATPGRVQTAAISRPQSVTVGRLTPIEGSEDDLIMAAAASAPIGSKDPADVAILQLAAALGDIRHIQQTDVRRVTPETKFSAVTIQAADSRDRYRVYRGDLDAVLTATKPGVIATERARSAALEARTEGYRPLAVARAKLADDGTATDWRLLGLVPLKAHAGKTPIFKAPTEWINIPLWDPALRAMHWIAMVCIVTLIVTGYYIARPFVGPATPEPQPYLMGYVRLIHYTTAWVLIATAIVRIADLFLSPYPYARWRSLIPFKNKEQFLATIQVTKGYLFFNTHNNPTWIGLNPLQAATYTAVYGLAIIMVVTGLAMYGLYNPTLWPFSWFQWLNRLLGAGMVRMIHYIGMWLFLIFIPAHIYLAARSDTIDRGGAISSMINGSIWVRKSAPLLDKTESTNSSKPRGDV
ncbi:MAG: Ni/Fe-hydrogenase, b-type cytochrome subunit [Anaerolineae bacterium]